MGGALTGSVWEGWFRFRLSEAGGLCPCRQGGCCLAGGERGVVRLPVVGGGDVVAGLGEHGVCFGLGLAKVRLRFVLGVVDSGGRGMLLGGRDAEFPAALMRGRRGVP